MSIQEILVFPASAYYQRLIRITVNTEMDYTMYAANLGWENHKTVYLLL